jgi:hypothetical protein
MVAGSRWKGPRLSIGCAQPHTMVKSCPRASSYHYCSRIISRRIFGEHTYHDMQKCMLRTPFKNGRTLCHHHNSARITVHMIVQLDSDFTGRLMYGLMWTAGGLFCQFAVTISRQSFIAKIVIESAVQRSEVNILAFWVRGNLMVHSPSVFGRLEYTRDHGSTPRQNRNNATTLKG